MTNELIFFIRNMYNRIKNQGFDFFKKNPFKPGDYVQTFDVIPEYENIIGQVISIDRFGSIKFKVIKDNSFVIHPQIIKCFPKNCLKRVKVNDELLSELI